MVVAVVLSAGCETVDRIKEVVAPEPAPARKAPISESSTMRKAPTTSEPAQARRMSPNPETAQPGASRVSALTALNEGIGLYDKGQFNTAIKRFNAPEISLADASIQTRALKYKAFSYCVTSRPALCRQQFERALKIDPAFDLEPGEKGHPLWGSVFEQAKKKR